MPEVRVIWWEPLKLSLQRKKHQAFICIYCSDILFEYSHSTTFIKSSFLWTSKIAQLYLSSIFEVTPGNTFNKNYTNNIKSSSYMSKHQMPTCSCPKGSLVFNTGTTGNFTGRGWEKICWFTFHWIPKFNVHSNS